MGIYKRITIIELCKKVCSGGTPKSTNAEYYDGNIPWLNTKEVNFNRIYKTEKNITELGLNNSSAKWIEANAVIVAMYGATAGKSAITKVPLTTNQACCNLMIDEEKADYRFVYYALCNDYIRLASLANGGAQQNLNAQQIKDFDIPYPEVATQQKIAKILSSLDDKIETNRRINEQLGELAQALFKSWFVDFEPFKDGNFVESELGMIPEGWKVGTLGDVADVVMGSSPAGSSYNTEGNGSIFYQGRTDFGFRFPCIRMYTTEPKRFAESNSVLLSVRAPVGDVNIAFEKCCIGRGLASIKSNCNADSFTYYLMKSLKPMLDNYNNEGTVFGCINKDALNNLSIIAPTIEIIKEFEKIVSSFDEEIRRRSEEITHLANLRDTLLPKLMSGEIDVNEVEI